MRLVYHALDEPRPNRNGAEYMTKADMICVAAIAGAFGVKGEVKLKSFTDVLEDCLAYGPLTDINGKLMLTPESWRRVGKFIAVCAPQVTTREQAEGLKSIKLYAHADNLPPPQEDEFYYRDLIGLSVKTQAGQNAGKILAVHDYGAGDMLEIQPPPDKGKKPASYYHPFTKAAVPKVDIKVGRVIIIPQIADEARREDEDHNEPDDDKAESL